MEASYHSVSPNGSFSLSVCPHRLNDVTWLVWGRERHVLRRGVVGEYRVENSRAEPWKGSMVTAGKRPELPLSASATYQWPANQFQSFVGSLQWASNKGRTKINRSAQSSNSAAPLNFQAYFNHVKDYFTYPSIQEGKWITISRTECQGLGCSQQSKYSFQSRKADNTMQWNIALLGKSIFHYHRTIGVNTPR